MSDKDFKRFCDFFLDAFKEKEVISELEMRQLHTQILSDIWRSDNIVSNDQALHDDIRKVNTQIRGDNLKIVYSYDEVTGESCYILINRCNTPSSCWSNLSVGKTRYSSAEVSYLRYLAELILQKVEKKLTSSNSGIDVALL